MPLMMHRVPNFVVSCLATFVVIAAWGKFVAESPCKDPSVGYVPPGFPCAASAAQRASWLFRHPSHAFHLGPSTFCWSFVASFLISLAWMAHAAIGPLVGLELHPSHRMLYSGLLRVLPKTVSAITMLTTGKATQTVRHRRAVQMGMGLSIMDAENIVLILVSVHLGRAAIRRISKVSSRSSCELIHNSKRGCH